MRRPWWACTQSSGDAGPGEWAMPERRRACPGPSPLHAEQPGEHEGRHDGGVGLDDELRRVDGELAPRDLLVRHGAGVAAVARRRVADLAEVAPQRHAGPLEILVQHRHDADRKVPGDAAADLEE